MLPLVQKKGIKKESSLVDDDDEPDEKLDDEPDIGDSYDEQSQY